MHIMPFLRRAPYSLFVLGLAGFWWAGCAGQTPAPQTRIEGPEPIVSKLRAVRAAIEKDPKNPQLYFEAGQLEEKLGRWDNALRDYQEATRLDPKFADAYYRAGIASEKTGQSYDFDIGPNKEMTSKMGGANRRYAINAYKEAVKLKPLFANAYYRLCLAYLLANDLENATEVYQQFQALEPDSDRAKALLEKIYALHQESVHHKP